MSSNNPTQRPTRDPQQPPGEVQEGGQTARQVPDEYLQELFAPGAEEEGGGEQAPAEVSLQKQRTWGTDL